MNFETNDFSSITAELWEWVKETSHMFKDRVFAFFETNTPLPVKYRGFSKLIPEM